MEIFLLIICIALSYIVYRAIQLEKIRLHSVFMYAATGVRIEDCKSVDSIGKAQYFIEQRIRSLPKYRNTSVWLQVYDDNIIEARVTKNILIEVTVRLRKR